MGVIEDGFTRVGHQQVEVPEKELEKEAIRLQYEKSHSPAGGCVGLTRWLPTAATVARKRKLGAAVASGYCARRYSWEKKLVLARFTSRV